MYIPRILGVVVLQCIESIQREEIMQVSGVYFINCFPAPLTPAIHPEPSRHGQCLQVAEILLLRAQIHKVTKILAWLAPLIAIAPQPSGKPYRIYVEETQGQFRPFANARVVDVRNIVDTLHIFIDFLNLFRSDFVGLTIEP